MKTEQGEPVRINAASHWLASRPLAAVKAVTGLGVKYPKVVMEVKPDDAGNIKLFSGEGVRGSNEAAFGPTQIQIIQQKEVLYPVIDELKLQEKWSSPGRSQIGRASCRERV